GPNPVPAKAAMQAIGLLATDAVRQPLLPLADADRERLTTTLRELGLLRTETARAQVPELVA
ncbi:MAG TPA: hypothetical protein VEX41_04770, partial [Candidatus Eisenbacteria bacterium]|nr:hypothetical protein [Candidatus Eisenbacteria bacterium]